MYRCSESQSHLQSFYQNSLFRKLIVDKVKGGTRKTIGQVELLKVGEYSEDTILEIPSPSKKEVSLILETHPWLNILGGHEYKSHFSSSVDAGKRGNYLI